jgi:hypothetical protein
MRAIQRTDDTVTVELATDELMAAANALNEVLNGPEAIEDWEFQTRMGLDREQAKQVHQGFLGLLPA